MAQCTDATAGAPAARRMPGEGAGPASRFPGWEIDGPGLRTPIYNDQRCPGVGSVKIWISLQFQCRFIGFCERISDI